MGSEYDGSGIDDYVNDIQLSGSFRSFKKVAEDCEDLLEGLGDILLSLPLICVTERKTLFLHSELLISCMLTLKNVTYCCGKGCLSDANILARKFRDDLFLYLYLVEVLRKRKGLTETELNSALGAEQSVDKWIKTIELTNSILISGVRKNEDDMAVDAWFDNRADNGKFKTILNFKNYLSLLKKEPLINDCVSEFDLDSIFKDISMRLNNYTHNNGRTYLDHNLLCCANRKDIDACLSSLSHDISFLTSVFLAFLILIKPNSIMACDYVFYLEVGLDPPEGSQYWVAPFVQRFINNYIAKLHPELKPFLRNNNMYGMLIE